MDEEISINPINSACWPDKKVPIKHFDIVAISMRIVYNKHGDHDPNGLIYVLRENEKVVKKLVAESPFTPVDLIQPLVIRANVGDLIIINFYNKLNRRASIHIQDVKYNVLDSDGAAIGYNFDSTTADWKQYLWFADKEEYFYLMIWPTQEVVKMPQISMGCL